MSSPGILANARAYAEHRGHRRRKIAYTVAGLLASAGYRLRLTDRSQMALDRVERHEHIWCVPLDVENSADLFALLNDQFAVINAAPSTYSAHCGSGSIHQVAGRRQLIYIYVN